MTKTILMLALLVLMTGTAMAQQAKVTPVMSKDLLELPGKEGRPSVSGVQGCSAACPHTPTTRLLVATS
jgi:hypothetical protein